MTKADKIPALKTWNPPMVCDLDDAEQIEAGIGVLPEAATPFSTTS